MWLILSSRIRTWLLLALALPLARAVIHRAAAAAAARRPTAKITALLGHADSALTALTRRATRRRQSSPS